MEGWKSKEDKDSKKEKNLPKEEVDSNRPETLEDITEAMQAGGRRSSSEMHSIKGLQEVGNQEED